MPNKSMEAAQRAFRESAISRTREQFLGAIIGNLSGALQDVIGLEDTKSFIAMVGDDIGAAWNEEYRDALGVGKLAPAEIAAALTDLKERIEGDFAVESFDEHKIVLRNSRCPFGDQVRGRPALCQMTSAVFGRIVADNLGFARVQTPQAIARGDSFCRVVIDFCDTGASAERADEYYGRSKP